MDSIIQLIVFILNILGSLGIFLYGIRTLSDSLKIVAGSKMRSILYNMTSNRIKGVLTGFLVTTIIQSSSATTVMVVSLVNSGLLTLTGAISIIMGANIGTTVTSWIISLIGFKVSMSALSLPLIGITFAFMFAKKTKMRAISDAFIGFGLLFIGLQFLQGALPDMTSNPEIYEFLAGFTEWGFWSLVVFVVVGLLLTVIIQSSSATMALTLVLCFNGILPFDCAAAMVIGENIGTTITALLAAMVGNKDAKRAALSHFIFNIAGAVLVFAFFNPLLNMIDNMMYEISGVRVIGGNLTDSAVKEAIPVALSIFHTIFNVANTFILIWFVNLLAKIVCNIIKGDQGDEDFNLMYISQGLMSTNELSTIQAKKEIAYMSQRTRKMIDLIPRMLNEKKDKELGQLMDKMYKYEEITDQMQWEITKYLAEIPKHGEISDEVTQRTLSMLKIVNEIENIGDIATQIGRTIIDKKSYDIHYTEEMYSDLSLIINNVNKAYDNMQSSLSGEYHLINTDTGDILENNINDIRDQLMNKYTRHFTANSDQTFKTLINFKEIFTTVERIGDIIQHVNYAVAECRE